MLCRTGQEVDILYRYNVFVDGDAIIFAMVHYLWLLGPHQPIEYLSNCLPVDAGPTGYPARKGEGLV